MFSFFLWMGSCLCVLRGSAGYCCPGRQNAQGHWTAVSLYKVALVATSTCLQSLSTHMMIQDQAGKPSQKHPWRRRALSGGAAKANACIMPGSQPWSKREFVFSLLCLGQNQRTYWTPPACLFTLPSFSPCSQLTAALVEVGGSLVFPGKHKKQRQVPKCLAWKKALFIPRSQGTLQSFGWDAGSEMPWTWLNSLSVQQTNRRSPQHGLG